MADSLLFRKGTLAGLAGATKVAGAVSFTTDEPAIYLDIQEGDEVVRKRIGDLIVYETAEELIAEGNTAVNGTVGPWSKTALYYVVESNALLKWTGSVWKQINSVSDIEGNITQLDDIVRGENGLVSQVTDLSSSIDAINDSTNGILAQAKSDATTKANQALDDAKSDAATKANQAKADAISEAKGYTDTQLLTVNQTISDLQSADTEIEKDIEANTKAISAETKRATDEETRISGLITAEASRADTEEKRLAKLISDMDAAYKAKDTELNGIINNVKSLAETHKTEQDAENAKIRSDFAAADNTLKTELKTYIDTNMAAADAMKYKGVITDGVLPTTINGPIEGGWTYKVSGSFATSNLIDTDEAIILTGDLLIASVDLDEDDAIPVGFWHHISSGYEDKKDPVLFGSVKSAEGDNTEGVEIALKSHLGDDRGSIAIVGATKSNVRIANVITTDDAQTGDTSTIITLGLEWGTF